MKQVRVKADDSQTITAIYEFLHDLDNEYSNFSKWYYSTVVPGLASENRIIYTVLDGQQPRLNRFTGYRRGLRGNP